MDLRHRQVPPYLQTQNKQCHYCLIVLSSRAFTEHSIHLTGSGPDDISMVTGTAVGREGKGGAGPVSIELSFTSEILSTAYVSFQCTVPAKIVGA